MRLPALGPIFRLRSKCETLHGPRDEKSRGYAAAQYIIKSVHYNIEDAPKDYKQSFYTMHANQHYLLQDFTLENSDVQGLLRVVD